MSRDLSTRRILITSGPTRANIDSVRYMTNRSSGRLGSRIATEALARGGRVCLVAGPGSRVPTEDEMSAEEYSRLTIREIETVRDLLEVLRTELTEQGRHYDAVVHAMAVLDYVPVQTTDGKMRSGREEWVLKLTPTPKVIERIKTWSPRSYLVGFKLEVDADEVELQERATALQRTSRANVVVANDLSRIEGGRHPALIVGRGGEVLARCGTKAEIGRELCSILARVLG